MEKNAALLKDLPEGLEAAMLLHLPLSRCYDIIRGADLKALGLGRPNTRAGQEISEESEKQNRERDENEAASRL